MSRKYIDKNTKDRYKRLSRFDDGSKSDSEAESKTIEFDEAISAPRSFYIKDPIKSADDDDKLITKIMELVNTAMETRIYIEDTNAHFSAQSLRINELKKIHSTFERQIRGLNTKPKEKKPE